ncbi:hypothetical protein HNP46_000484 [Pseudomonas nitritireducens]|uniref:Uncharacterized protein n=1 Tax=Pseudomonas nitroreducens TaxID=46680 RepID=A0A7W7KG56_PSENT|nr:hypothetical protein [Pseudomonas nitritireducens]MBB4861673.1 hypothetical protein [Pseudomonas nitritireducens]
MIACCFASMQKFISVTGELDKPRLEKAVASCKPPYRSDEAVKRIEQCRCICHQDGNNVWH